MSTRNFVAACAMALAAAVTPASANSDGEALETLRLQIQALQERLTALESLTTFTTFMPSFAERFHVMHHAGEAGDWAVASHELAELQRIAKLATVIDSEKGQLLNAMMTSSFAALGAAIGHGNAPEFETALTQTITTCNACHTATGSGFIEVTLDVSDVMSMRHPHRLVARGVPAGHSHDMPAAGMEMMQDAETPGMGHDDAGKPKHKH